MKKILFLFMMFAGLLSSLYASPPNFENTLNINADLRISSNSAKISCTNKYEEEFKAVQISLIDPIDNAHGLQPDKTFTGKVFKITKEEMEDLKNTIAEEIENLKKLYASGDIYKTKRVLSSISKRIRQEENILKSGSPVFELNARKKLTILILKELK